MMDSHPHYPSGEAGFIGLIDSKLVSSAKKAARHSAPSRTARCDVADHALVYLIAVGSSVGRADHRRSLLCCHANRVANSQCAGKGIGQSSPRALTARVLAKPTDRGDRDV